MQGQMTIFDIERKSLREIHEIPELSQRWRAEEGWTDHWHYVDEEQPKEDGFYWTVSLAKSWYDGVTTEFYNHTYGLYHDGIWLAHNDGTKKWQPWWKDHTLVCWAVMPQCYWTEDFIEKSTHDIDKYRVEKERRKQLKLYGW